MYFDDVKKVFSAIGIQVEVEEKKYGNWKGYHYSYNAFNEGWVNNKVTDVSETFEQAVAKVVMKASFLIVQKRDLLHGITVAGYKINDFIYSSHG